MSESPNPLVEALYEKFLLRDVFGKIAPGIVTMGVLLYAIYPKFTNGLVLKLDWHLLTVAIPIAWLTALIVQSVGEKIRYIHLWPKDMGDQKKRYALRNSFMAKASPFEKQQALRFELISESSGIFGTTCLIAAITLGIIGFQARATAAGPDEWWRHLCLSFLLFIASYLLRIHHISHTTKRYDYYKSVVGKDAS
jgi:hypothetical protein